VTYANLVKFWRKLDLRPCVSCQTGTAGRCSRCGEPLCCAWSCTSTYFGAVLCADCHELLIVVVPEGVTWSEERGRWRRRTRCSWSLG
jgi:hypothetical protein